MPRTGPTSSLRHFLTTALTPAAKWLLLVELAAFAAYLAAGRPAFVRDHLALTPARAILGLEPWQIVTSIFIHVDGVAALFGVIGLVALAPLVERATSTSRLLSLFLVCGVAANLAGALVGLVYAPATTTGGCGPSLLALVAMFGFLYRKQPLLFFGFANARADRLAAVLIGLTLLLQLFGRDVAGFASSLVAVGMAALAATGTLPSDRLFDALRHWHSARRRARLRRGYTVLRGGDDAERDRPDGGPAGHGPGKGGPKRYLN